MDDYNYSLDEYVSSDNDERLKQIEIAKARREEQNRIRIAEMFLQDIMDVILAAGARTDDAEGKFAKMIE